MPKYHVLAHMSHRILGSFAIFGCRLLIFRNQLSKIISGMPSVSNSLDPDQARNYVGPDQGSNCLQKLPVDVTRRQLHVVKTAQ